VRPGSEKKRRIYPFSTNNSTIVKLAILQMLSVSGSSPAHRWCTRGSVSFRFGVIWLFNAPWFDHWLQSWRAPVSGATCLDAPPTASSRVARRHRREFARKSSSGNGRPTTRFYTRHQCCDLARCMDPMHSTRVLISAFCNTDSTMNKAAILSSQTKREASASLSRQNYATLPFIWQYSYATRGVDP